MTTPALRRTHWLVNVAVRAQLLHADATPVDAAAPLTVRINERYPPSPHEFARVAAPSSFARPEIVDCDHSETHRYARQSAASRNSWRFAGLNHPSLSTPPLAPTVR
jgi:hypothetical protein